jgi:hypothetical protein
MLLLLLDQPFLIEKEELSSFGACFNDCSKWKISDLFDVTSGILEERYLDFYINEAGVKQEVNFIRMDTIRGNENTFKLPDGREKIDSALEEKAKVISEDNPKKSNRVKVNQKEIPLEKILKPDDYLISTRGDPRGISLMNYESTLFSDIYSNLVPTHHFIVLRPKAAIIKNKLISIQLLHLMLNLVVENVFKTNYAEKIEEIKKQKQAQAVKNKNIIRRSAASFFASVKVDEIKERELNLPNSHETQYAVFNKLKELEEEKRRAEMKYDFWLGKLFEKINDD